MQLWTIYHPDVPVFLHEAAQSPAMQRLTEIGMNCGCEYTGFSPFAEADGYSRFDHSMGAALIVWHFTHDQTQAMAALLHDIATPAFAHVIDFLRGDHMKQESTENGTAEMILASDELRRVCSAHGIDPHDVTDYHRYPIADNDSPRLSADRLEYTLGNAVNWNILTREQAAALYDDLVVAANESGETELCFRHADAALAFAEAALRCSEIYVSPADRYAMQRLAELLKRAVEQHVLAEIDLYRPEPEIIAKLLASPMATQWTDFRRLSRIISSNVPGKVGVWLQVPAKKRFIDPYIIGHGRTSALFPAFAQKLADFRAVPQNEWLCAE